MAERRMFAKTIIDSDAFIDMPVTARLLYYDLSMRADDDGFVNSPKKIMRMIGASQDDLSILIMRRFIIPFDSGVVVIKHWRIHNYIRSDRKHETKYEKEMSQLSVKENGSYTLRDDSKDESILIECESEENKEETARQKAYRESELPYSFSYKIRNAFYGKACPICGKTMSSSYLCMPTIQHNIPVSKGGKHELGNISVICQSCNTSIRDKETGALNAEEVIKVWDDICQSSDSQMSVKCHTEDRLGKDRLGKDSKEEKRKRFTPPTIDEVKSYCSERNNNVDANKFIDYYESNGWMVGRNKMKDWKAAVRSWERNNYGSPKQQSHVVEEVPDYMRKQIDEMDSFYSNHAF